jgi:hypothetical protein
MKVTWEEEEQRNNWSDDLGMLFIEMGAWGE